MRGLQNIIILNTEYLLSDIGLLLGVVKTYMVFGIKGIDFITPTKVMPTVLEIPEPTKITIPRENKGGKVSCKLYLHTTKPGNLTLLFIRKSNIICDDCSQFIKTHQKITSYLGHFVHVCIIYLRFTGNENIRFLVVA